MDNFSIGNLISGAVADLQQRLRNKALDGGPAGMFTGDNNTGTSYLDQLFSGGRGGANISLRAPVPSDIWYLVEAVDKDGVTFDILTEDMKAALASFLDNHDAGGGAVPVDYVRVPRDLAEAKNGTGPQKVYEMRFQTIPPGQGFTWPIDGMTTEVVAFLDFLVGPVGVMETLSLSGESTGGLGEVKQGGQLLPPPPSAPNTSPGLLAVTGGFLPASNVQILAPNLPGEREPQVHNWLRVIIRRDQKYPYPGEFMGLLARPLVQFIWFSQQSSPFLYSGNWFETDCYTSGVVEEVRDSITEPKVGKEYLVWVRDQHIWAAPTDFAEYAVDQWVALIKKVGSPAPFSWKDLGDVQGTWVIAPVQFYQEGE